MGPASNSVQGALLRELEQTPEVDRRHRLLAQIGHQVQEILGRETPSSLSPDQRIFELGMASLNLVELKNRLEVGFDVELPVTLFFKYGVLGQLTQHLLTEVLALAPREAEPAETAVLPEPALETQGTAVEEMSEAEAEAELKRRLASLEGE